MGLDVYLRRCDDLASVEKVEKEHQDREEEIWAEYPAYDDMTEEQKDEARERVHIIEENLGLGEWGVHQSIEEIKTDSKLHPDHLFKLGYFRSSYNSGGINSMADRLSLPTLWDIFQPPDEPYRFTPDWEASLERAKGAVKQWGSEELAFDVIGVHANMFNPDKVVKSDQEALKVFKEKVGGRIDEKDEHFTTLEGYFATSGMKIYAVLPGTGRFGEQGAYIIHKADNLNWYVQALEIVIETIEWVLSQPNPNTYFLVWSY